jgi:hypothetical protein
VTDLGTGVWGQAAPARGGGGGSAATAGSSPPANRRAGLANKQ